jgi:hypothetical protein
MVVFQFYCMRDAYRPAFGSGRQVRGGQLTAVRRPPQELTRELATSAASASATSAGYSGSRSSQTICHEPSIWACPSGRAKNQACRCATVPDAVHVGLGDVRQRLHMPDDVGGEHAKLGREIIGQVSHVVVVTRVARPAGTH